MAVKLDDSFFKITGDPFVDAGGMAIEFLDAEFKGKTFEDLIDFTADLFIEKWLGKINSLQLNSNITHNTKTGSTENREKALISVKEYFSDIFGDCETSSVEGWCRTCGNSGKLFKAGRELFCLSGSGGLVNFHHSHDEGLMLCSRCSAKLFFLPLIVIQLGGNIGLLHVQSEPVKKYWLEQTIKKNLDSISRNTSTGLLKSDFSNPRNALFKAASDLIINFDVENEYLQLFHFTNFGASPDCEIYNIPNQIFVFLSKVIKACPKDWFLFTKRHYYIKKSEWDFREGEWKSKDSVIKTEDFKNNKNGVFEALLSGKSILPMMTRFYKENFLNKIKINSVMAYYYLKEVRNMSAEQVALIKRLGSSIVELARKEDNFKKYLTMIEGAGKAYQLRSVLLTLIKKNYTAGEEKPLISLQEYVENLFPDGQYWGEVRDLLLIYIYELLHEENLRGIDIEDVSLEEPDQELNSL